MTETTFLPRVPHSHTLSSKQLQGVNKAERLSLKFCCLCFQVQIYELEEHKIETWRGMWRAEGCKRIKGWRVSWETVFHGNILWTSLFPSEVYLQDSFKPLVCISPNARWVPPTYLSGRGKSLAISIAEALDTQRAGNRREKRHSSHIHTHAYTRMHIL